MQRRTKWGLSTFSLLSAAALALTACSGGASSGQQRDCSQPIKIGVVTSQTGATAFLGELAKAGVDVAVGEINKDGPLLGCEIQVVTRDDQSDPAQALAAVQNLIEREKVDVIVSAQTSSASLAISPYVNENGMLNILSFGTNEALYDVHKYPENFGFSIVATPGAKGNANHAADLGFGSVVYAVEDSAYGDGVLKAVNAAMTDKGIKEAGTIRWSPDGANLDSFALQVKDAAAKADFVYVCGQPAGLARLFQSFQRVGNALPIQGCQSLRAPAFLEAVGSSIPDKTITISVDPPQYRNDVENTARFNTAFEAAEGHAATDEAWVYSSVRMWADAVRKAGTTDPAKVKEALESMTGYTGGANAPLSFSPDNHISLADPNVFVPLFLTRDSRAVGQCGPSTAGAQFCDAETLTRLGIPVPTY
jgi:branched-chain amino acid transport system substrate-binding protein